MRLSFLACLIVGLLPSPTHSAQQAQTPRVQRVVVPWTTAQQLFVSGHQPEYPTIAALAHVEGTVRINFVIAVDGSTKELVYLSGPMMLEKAAENALRSWRFRPPTSGGIPIEVETIASFDFHQNDGPVKSADALRKDVEKHPKDVKKRIALGDVLLGSEQADAAETVFRQALTLQPDNVTAHSGLGATLRAKGDLDGAINEYRQAVALNPKDGKAHSDLSDLLEQKGDLDGAISEYRSAMQMGASGGPDCGRLGMLLLKKGDTAGAIDELKRTQNAGCDEAQLHYELGQAEEQSGRLDDALGEYRQAASLDPNVTEYELAVERLAAKSKS